MTTFTLKIVIQTNEELVSFLLRDDLPLVSDLTIYYMNIDNLDFLQRCTQLKNLSLGYLPNVKCIPMLPDTIQYLDITHMNIDNLDFLSRCWQLHTLSLRILPLLSSIPILPSSLVELNISYVPIDNVDFLQTYDELKTLILYDLQYVKYIRSLPRGLVELSVVFVDIDNVDFLANCTHLKKLTLRLFSDVSIQEPVKIQIIHIDNVSDLLQRFPHIGQFEHKFIIGNTAN